MLIKATLRTSFLAVVVLVILTPRADASPKVVGNRKDSDDADGTVAVLNIQDHNKTQYLNQNFDGGRSGINGGNGAPAGPGGAGGPGGSGGSSSVGPAGHGGAGGLGGGGGRSQDGPGGNAGPGGSGGSGGSGGGQAPGGHGGSGGGGGFGGHGFVGGSAGPGGSGGSGGSGGLGGHGGHGGFGGSGGDGTDGAGGSGGSGGSGGPGGSGSSGAAGSGGSGGAGGLGGSNGPFGGGGGGARPSYSTGASYTPQHDTTPPARSTPSRPSPVVSTQSRPPAVDPAYASYDEGSTVGITPDAPQPPAPSASLQRQPPRGTSSSSSPPPSRPSAVFQQQHPNLSSNPPPHPAGGEGGEEDTNSLPPFRYTNSPDPVHSSNPYTGGAGTPQNQHPYQQQPSSHNVDDNVYNNPPTSTEEYSPPTTSTRQPTPLVRPPQVSSPFTRPPTSPFTSGGDNTANPPPSPTRRQQGRPTTPLQPHHHQQQPSQPQHESVAEGSTVGIYPDPTSGEQASLTPNTQAYSHPPQAPSTTNYQRETTRSHPQTNRPAPINRNTLRPSSSHTEKDTEPYRRPTNTHRPQPQYSQEQFSQPPPHSGEGFNPAEYYGKIPGAVVSNVPVIFYPDCNAAAFSQPAIVPYCPAAGQGTSCPNESPLLSSQANFRRSAYVVPATGRRTARRVVGVKRRANRRLRE